MRAFRVFLFVAAAIILPSAVLILVAGGDVRFALSGLLWGAAALLMATWAWGYPTAYPVREWTCLGLMAAGLAVLGQVVVAIGGLLVFFLLSVASGRLMLRRMSSVEFESVGPDELMAGAEGTVAEFEAEGFRRVGGYRARLPVVRKVVTASVLAGPDGDRFAVVTDRVWEVVSGFGHRWLLTTASGLAPLPPHILRQTLSRARPDELVRAHRATVEFLAGRGLEPDRYEDDAAVVDAGRAIEADAARFVSGAPMKSFVGIETTGKSEDSVLDDDHGSRRRIDAWLHAPEPA